MTGSSQDPPSAKPHHPTYIGIHSRDDSTQLLYVSSGSREALGYTPAFLTTQKAKHFIADNYDSNDYPRIYDSKDDADEEEENNEANAYVMYLNIKTASGTPVLMRVTSFKCDNCVIYISMTFPEIPFRNRGELEVQMLDGAMKKLNVTQEQNAARKAAQNRVLGRSQNAPLYYSKNRQIKAAFVLENPNLPEMTTDEAARRPTGPLIAFVTGSVSRLVDADPSDLSNYPFMKLVAPEDVLHVCKFFDRLADATDVLFETFALLQRPHVIDGDVVIADADNTRVVVEALGASTQDGLVVLLRKLKLAVAPKRDTLGNYIHSRVHEIDDDGGYVSLAELLSSDPETSDAPGWSLLN
ncbi:hypothetical protein GGF46_001400 [Coemansia sp. RSA 552]|nr:hypothetical protein GGF46_001400 [Coemansia sp. RSA 552]